MHAEKSVVVYCLKHLFHYIHAHSVGVKSVNSTFFLSVDVILIAQIPQTLLECHCTSLLGCSFQWTWPCLEILWQHGPGPFPNCWDARFSLFQSRLSRKIEEIRLWLTWRLRSKQMAPRHCTFLTEGGFLSFFSHRTGLWLAKVVSM